MKELIHLNQDFLQNAKMYGRIIILERHLPLPSSQVHFYCSSYFFHFCIFSFLYFFVFIHVFFFFLQPKVKQTGKYVSTSSISHFFKTILPINVGGRAGGEKYIINNILFKVFYLLLFPFFFFVFFFFF